MKMKPLLTLAVVVSSPLLLLGCQHAGKNDKADSAVSAVLIGEYVSAGYEKRTQGYDWVAVNISNTGQSNTISIDIHARDDIKKPTCQLKTTAIAVGDNAYRVDDDGTAILFRFDADTLTISPDEGTNRHALMYYCSGGASIAGSYQRLVQ